MERCLARAKLSLSHASFNSFINHNAFHLLLHPQIIDPLIIHNSISLSPNINNYIHTTSYVVMPFKRCKSQIPVPPPSPVPTGKGLRSAANEPLTNFLENTVPYIPELSLPEAYMPAMMIPSAGPAVVDYRMLKNGCTDGMVRSAKEFGAFRICGHGISGQELGIVVEHGQRMFQMHDPLRDIIPCVRSRKGTLEFTAPKFFHHHTHRNFWIHMGNVGSRLDGIVEQVLTGLCEGLKERIIEETECEICLCRYPHDNASRQGKQGSASWEEKNDRMLWDHVLRFYLPMEQCIFYVQSERGPLSFDAAPHTIVVTIGRQLEEWSKGEFKCVSGEMIFMPSFESRQASFSIELKCCSSNLNSTASNKFSNIITLSDQLLIVLCLSFLYKFLLYFFFSSS